MKIFVSSVRRGLEAERDALPGLLRALGHEPLRFEDFTAQPVASRDACLEGVEQADVYVLLLGPWFGEPVFDTGLSPTEEELNVARRRGIPILVFRKRGVEMEGRQQQFVARVEEYTGGRFRATFDGPVDLQPQVVQTIADLAAQPEALAWLPLPGPVLVSWINSPREFGGFMGAATLELHLIAVEPRRRLQVRELEALAQALSRVGRDHGLFASGEAVEELVGPDEARAFAGGERRGEQRGIRVLRDGTVSIWVGLPSDELGQIFDPSDIIDRLRAALLLASELTSSTAERIAPAVGVAPVGMLVEGRVEDLGHRTSATIGSPREEAALVDPEDAFPRTALPLAASEVAIELTARLKHRFRRLRQW